MHWTDRLHRQLIAISDVMNRLDVDARLLAESGVTLDRALFPLLTRIGLYPDIILVQLANLMGRDHSTISRQLAKLENQSLVVRTPNAKDRRVQHLRPSAKGAALLDQINTVRRGWAIQHFCGWSTEDRDQMIAAMERMAEGADATFASSLPTPNPSSKFRRRT